MRRNKNVSTSTTSNVLEFTSRQSKKNGATILVGGNIRRIRIENCLEINEAAQQLGISVEELESIESGRVRASVSLLCYIAKLLKAPIGHFYYGLK